MIAILFPNSIFLIKTSYLVYYSFLKMPLSELPIVRNFNGELDNQAFSSFILQNYFLFFIEKTPSHMQCKGVSE